MHEEKSYESLAAVVGAVGRAIVIIAVIFLAVYLGIYLWSLLMPPLEPVALSSHPDPAATFDEAMSTRFDGLLAEEKGQRAGRSIRVPAASS